ncbi:MAG: hypothetical protein QW275_00050 [Candidatus Anstonellaceae archaeon]
MKKGFLSFIIASIFAFAIISSASLLQTAQKDTSYESYRAIFLEEVAIKRAFFAALSDAASKAHAKAAGTLPTREEVRLQAYLRAIEFERQLQELGYDVVFWCGEISEEGQREASLHMQKEGSAAIPAGAFPIHLCEGSIDSSLAQRKLHFFALGFSYYSKQLGIGKAVRIPADYEVDF